MGRDPYARMLVPGWLLGVGSRMTDAGPFPGVSQCCVTRLVKGTAGEWTLEIAGCWWRRYPASSKRGASIAAANPMKEIP